MASRKGKSEALMGLFVLIGLIVLGNIVLRFSGIGQGLEDHYPLTAQFQNSDGLVKGAEVRLGGTVIGFVSANPRLTDDYKAEIELMILSSIKVPAESEFLITSIGLLGDKMVQITPPGSPVTQFYSANDQVVGRSAAGLEQLQGEVGRVVEQAVETLAAIKKTAETLDGALTKIDSTVDSLGSTFISEENGKNFQSVLKNLDTVSADLATASDQLPGVISDMRQTLASVETTARNANETFSTATEQLKTLKPAIDEIPPAVRSLAETSRKAGRAIDKIENGDGLLNTLTADKEVADDTKSFITNLKKYGILRYRDAETNQATDPRDRYIGRRR